MNNRTTLALAVMGGYVLGRTKKAKLAIGVGSMVLGKKLNLNPQQLAGTVRDQLKSNPQLAEIGDQLRGDLTGVGKAAAGAMVSRRLDALAGSLQERTRGIQDQLAPEAGGGQRDADGSGDDAAAADEEDPEEPEGRAEPDADESDGDREENGGSGAGRPGGAKAAGTAKRKASSAAPARSAGTKAAGAAKSATGGTKKKTNARSGAAKDGRSGGRAAKGGSSPSGRTAPSGRSGSQKTERGAGSGRKTGTTGGARRG